MTHLIHLALLAGIAALDVQPAGAADFAGTWEGTARICVNWTVQKTLPVHVTILPDGRVSGTVGDATLRNGRFASNRGPLLRALGWKTDWAVTADLDGPVIQAEGLYRDRVTIPIDWVGDHFEGGVNTSGSHVGGKGTMWLAAARLHLERVPCPSPPDSTPAATSCRCSGAGHSAQRAKVQHELPSLSFWKKTERRHAGMCVAAADLPEQRAVAL
jgi:hypothetical protein